MKRIDLTGKKFGKITILSFSHTEKKGKTRWLVYWNAICDCGTELVVNTRTLKENRKLEISCGCVFINKLKNTNGDRNPKWKGKGPIPGKMFSSLKRGAKNRGLEFSITLEDMLEQLILQNYKCALTGDPLQFQLNSSSQGRKDGNASLDRIDSSLGYTKTNIQWVLKSINRMKFDLPQNLLIELCEKVIKNAKKRID